MSCLYITASDSAGAHSLSRKQEGLDLAPSNPAFLAQPNAQLT